MHIKRDVRTIEKEKLREMVRSRTRSIVLNYSSRIKVLVRHFFAKTGSGYFDL